MTKEVATAFPCEGDTLVGVLGLPETARDTGVVILAGGPQYRVGSHRQFVSLARHLSDGGFPTLRFDFRGMGDSTGEPRGFEDVDADIRVGIDHLLQTVPSVRKVVLWGLCDAASAAMMYGPSDARVAGLALANPWARSNESYAKTLLVHYYLSRLFSREFWERLGSQQLNLRKSATEFFGNVAASTGPTVRKEDYRTRMADAMKRIPASVLFLLSGKDLTCREFEAFAETELRDILANRKHLDQWIRLPAADHTFSGSEAGTLCSTHTMEWIQERVAQRPLREESIEGAPI